MMIWVCTIADNPYRLHMTHHYTSQTYFLCIRPWSLTKQTCQSSRQVVWTRRTGKGPYRVLRNGSCSTMQIELSLERSAKSPGVKRMFEKPESRESCVIKKKKTFFSSELWARFGHLDSVQTMAGTGLHPTHIAVTHYCQHSLPVKLTLC